MSTYIRPRKKREEKLLMNLENHLKTEEIYLEFINGNSNKDLLNRKTTLKFLTK